MKMNRIARSLAGVLAATALLTTLRA